MTATMTGVQSPEETNLAGQAPGSIADNASQAADSVAPVTSTTNTTPNAAPPVVAQTPSAPKPHPLASALDAVLKGATGGDVYYTDPQGQRKLAPQSRGTLGKTLIAATLAGLLTSDKYRDTPYGPVRDYTGSAGGALEASQNKINEMRERPQKMSDEMQAKKLMTIQNNSNLIALQSASARLKHQNQDENAAAVENGLSPFKEYESLRTSNNDPSQPPAFISQGLTHDQVLAKGPDGKPAHKLTDSNVIQDGWTSKWNEDTHQMEPEPTYAVLNPDLKDVTLPKNVTEMLAKVNSQWQDIHRVVGGTVKIPVNAYVSAMHDYSAVMQSQQILDALNKTVNGKDAKPLTVDAIATAARSSRERGANMLPALYQLSHAVAGGNLPADGERPDNLLHTLLTSPNGNEILKLIGLTPEEASNKADEFNAERVKQLALAKEGGISDKSPADPEKIAKLPEMADALGLTPEQTNLLTSKANTAGMTQGEYKEAVNKIQSQANTNNENAIKAGDPVQLQKTANNIIEGDLSSLKDLMNARSTVKATANNMIQDEARKRGLDPTRYTLSAQQAKSDMYKDYSGASTKTGAQLVSFGALLGHIAEGYDASEAWTRSGSELLNHSMSWLAKNATNDQNFKRFQTDIIAPAKEYMNFLNQNRAEHEQDIKSLEGVLSENNTPAGAITALKSFAKTADIRAANLGQKYIQAVGSTYPVVNPTGVAILNRLLGKGQSQAAAVSANIPRGWQNNQSTSPSPQVLATIFAAAGRDPNTARQLARENGWLIPNQ